MNILVSGPTGMVGSALLPYLSAKGHTVKKLVRGTPGSGSDIRWNPPKEGPDSNALDGLDAVVHLAGESIAAGRWTEARKRAIRDSRVLGTRLLTESLVRMGKPPSVLICASAIGYYGDRGSEALREDSSAGTGFLSEVCQAWEASSMAVAQKGIRLVHLRFGIILSPKGGALPKMLPPFKLGVGGVLGSGTQYMSWVALDDVLGIVNHALETPLRGPVNVVTPQPVTNAEFTQTLGHVLHRPTIFPLPAFAARLAFGEMADALLLSSARVDPSVLIHSGYQFQYGNLEAALRHLLQK